MEWAILPLLLSRRASSHFGRYSFFIPLRVEGWVSLDGWLHTQMVYAQIVTPISLPGWKWSNFIGAPNVVTTTPHHHTEQRNFMLQWLPVRQRVLFNIAVFVFQCLTGHQAPAYLAEDCQLVSNFRPRRLRSSDSSTWRRWTWSVFCCSRAAGLELLAGWTATVRLSCLDLLLRVMGPRRSVTL